MRKKIGVVVFCLVACSLSLTVQPAFSASATIDTAWVPRDANVSTFQWVFAEGTYSFGIFDFNNETNEAVLSTSSSESLVLGDTYSTSLEFSEIANSDDVNLAITTSQITYHSSGITINPVQTSNIILQDSNEFGFFFSNSTDGTKDSTSYNYDYTLLNDGQNDFYNLEWTGANASVHIVTVDDARPVPIPTAMLLLTSGLVGLAGFKRKMDN